MKIVRIGLDLAKDVFQVHGVDRDEKPVWRRKLKRAEWLKRVGWAEPGEAQHLAEALGFISFSPTYACCGAVR